MSSGIGQRFTMDQLPSWNSSHGLGRKTAGGGDLSPGSRKNLLVSGLPPQPPGQQSQVQPPPLQFGQQRPKKTGLFGEEEDSETSMYFPQSNLFRPDRDMMSSNSPSQLTGGFSNQNFYSQGSLNPSNLGMSSLGMSSSLGGSALGGGSSLGSSALSASSLGGTAFGGSSTTGVTAFGGSSTTGGTGFGGSGSTGSTGFGGSGSTGSTGFGGSGSTGSTGFGGSGSTGSTGFGGSGSTGSTAFGGSGSTGSTAFGGSGSTGSTSFGGTSATGTTSGSSSIIGSSLGGATSSSFSALPQRSAIYGPQFRGNNATPTSMNPNLPFSLQQPQQQPSPNRNISAIGGQRSSMTSQQSMQSISKLQNSTSGPMTGMSNTYGFGSSRQIFGADENQPGLDLSEFPTLGNRSNLPSNPLPSSVRNYGQYRTFGMVSKPVTESTPEFQIQQEDFPALPGAQNPPSSTANDSSRKTPTSSASNTYDVNSSKDWKFPFDKSTNLTKRGIQTSPDGTVSNIPSGMVTDQFGIAGLLTFIRAAEFEPSLVALAPGKDLTTLGLNLNSPENLYSTFQSPWADSPCRPQDIDFHVPAEYLTNIFIRDKLAPIKLNRYGEDLLFFLFYMNGSDVIQLAAAAELYSRDWRYHKEERVWITRVPGVEPLMKTNTFERGTYYFYDAQSWRKVPKEFYLEYDKLEDRPTLPPTIHHNAQTVMAH